MLETKYVYKDGSEVPQNYCVLPDHWETKLTITIKSRYALDLGRIKSDIQRQREFATVDNRHEVVAIEKVEETCVVR